MTRPDPDDVLRERFRALAAEDQRAAPAFSMDPTVRTDQTGWSGSRLAVAAALVLAAAGLATNAWRTMRPAPLPYPIDLGAVTWSGPTDFLLDTPGAALLRELPTIVTEPGGSAPARGLNDDTLRRNRS